MLQDHLYWEQRNKLHKEVITPCALSLWISALWQTIQDIKKHTARLLNSFHTKTITTLKAAVSSPKQWLKNSIHFMFTTHVSTLKLLTVRKVCFVPFFSFLIYSILLLLFYTFQGEPFFKTLCKKLHVCCTVTNKVTLNCEQRKEWNTI